MPPSLPLWTATAACCCTLFTMSCPHSSRSAEFLWVGRPRAIPQIRCDRHNRPVWWLYAAWPKAISRHGKASQKLWQCKDSQGIASLKSVKRLPGQNNLHAITVSVSGSSSPFMKKGNDFLLETFSFGKMAEGKYLAAEAGLATARRPAAKSKPVPKASRKERCHFGKQEFSSSLGFCRSSGLLLTFAFGHMVCLLHVLGCRRHCQAALLGCETCTLALQGVSYLNQYLQNLAMGRVKCTAGTWRRAPPRLTITSAYKTSYVVAA